MYDLSICIPARNEQWLAKTVKNILENKRGKTEVIVVLDGQWAEPEIEDHKDVRIIYLAESIGQRAAQNLAVKLSTAKYVAKTDAHCAFSEGFDVELMKTFDELGENIVVAPLMKNLHAFDWKCMKCGKRTYQGPKPVDCEDCDNVVNFTQKAVFKPRHRTPNSTSYRVDRNLHFQYANEFKSRSYQVNGTIKGYRLSFDFASVPSSVIDFLTNLADSHALSGSGDSFRRRQNMSSDAMGLSTVNESGSIRTPKILSIGSQLEMEGVATSPVFTEMVKNWDILASTLRKLSDKPSVGNPVCELFLPEIGASTISTFVDSPRPVPAPSSVIRSDIIDKLNGILGREFIYNEKTNSFHNKSVTLQPVYGNDLVESMSLQGSFFMATRENYWRLELCDETWGSWGQQGAEVALKTWLSGSRVIINKRCWYAHLFRTQAGFSFPYAQSGSQQQRARDICNDIFKNNKWHLQKYPLSWLVEKFAPVPGWSKEDLAKIKAVPLPSKFGILYFTDNELPLKIAKPVQKRIRSIAQQKGMELISSTRKPMIDMGKNLVTNEPRGYLTMFKQILKGLEAMNSEIVFMAEHDVLYPPEHFDFVPNDRNKFYYDTNWWKVREDGFAIHWDADQVSGLCAYRDKLIEYYKWRVETFDKKNFDRKFEPFSGEQSEQWKASVPHIDIRHGRNLTFNKWSINHFRKKETAVNLQESTIEKIPNWNLTAKDIYG